MSTCICFKLRVVHRIACALSGWPDWLLRVCFFKRSVNNHSVYSTELLFSSQIIKVGYEIAKSYAFCSWPGVETWILPGGTLATDARPHDLVMAVIVSIWVLIMFNPITFLTDEKWCLVFTLNLGIISPFEIRWSTVEALSAIFIAVRCNEIYCITHRWWQCEISISWQPQEIVSKLFQIGLRQLLVAVKRFCIIFRVQFNPVSMATLWS